MLKNRRISIFFIVLAGCILAGGGGHKEVFAKTSKAHTIFARAEHHGTILPSGRIKVNRGGDQTFVITPNPGYRVFDVKIDGKSIGPVLIYTFTNIATRHTIRATFRPEETIEKSEFYSAPPRMRGQIPGAPISSPEIDTQRTIEEGDIVKVNGDTLFILNPYRGLITIDTSNLEAPSLLSVLPVYGHPVEMYIRGDYAYTVVSDFFDYSYNLLKGMPESFYGSYIGIVDLKDKRSPKVLGGINIQGEITDTRMVGDVLYAVSNRSSYPLADFMGGITSLTAISSISIANPLDVRIVDELSFERESFSYQNNVHVTSSMVFLSRAGWGYYERNEWIEKNSTEIICFDISDEGGVIKQGRSFDVPGVVQNRWQMDFFNGYFRVITPEQSWGNGFPSLFIYKVDSLDIIEQVSKLTIEIDRPESLTSVRFDGERAYAVTFERKDPLFAIDLKDPANPRQGGEIEMPGWIDYIEPKEDHLVALGHDNSEGKVSLAVTLFDVSQIEKPVLASRIIFGEDWGWVPAEINEIHKAFKVLDEAHLILIPFNSWSSEDGQEISGVQLIDYYFDTQEKELTKRGVITHSGWVERTISTREEKVMTVSNEAFQVVDISNRDDPRIKKLMELARNSIDFSPFRAGEGLELSKNSRGWFYNGRTKSKLSIVPLMNPNAPEPADSMEMRGDYFRLIPMKDFYVLVGNDIDEKGNLVISFKTVKHDGNEFSILGTFSFPWSYPGPIILSGLMPILPFYQPLKIQKISDEALVVDKCDDLSEAGPMDQVCMTVVDFSDPQAIKANTEAKIELNGGYSTYSFWDGFKFYLSYAVPSGEQEGRFYYKYFFKSVDFSDPNQPLISKEVNVPGEVVGTSTNGQYLYTVDYQYAPMVEMFSYEVYLNSLELVGDKAYLMDRKMILPIFEGGIKYDWIGKVVVRDQRAYLTAYRSQCADNGNPCSYNSDLITASFLDPSKIQFPSSLNLEVQGAEIVDLVQDRLFLFSYGGGGVMTVYSLENPIAPIFEASLRTSYPPENIVVIQGKAYLPSGMYGVQIIPLE